MSNPRRSQQLFASAVGAAAARLATEQGVRARADELEAQADYYRETGDRETATDLRHQAQALRRSVTPQKGGKRA